MSDQKISKKAQVRIENTGLIIEAAERVFARLGFAGSTMQKIADEAGLPKANIHYYFPAKRDLYVAVLEDIFREWRKDADAFELHDDPATALSAYIKSKLAHSFARPDASKVWATEIIQGAPVIGEDLNKDLVPWMNSKVSVIQTWMDKGLIAKVSPQNLIYTIWATTQHFADFKHQIKIINDNQDLNQAQRLQVEHDVTTMLLRSVGLELSA